MKISKRDLRRLILENILKEEEKSSATTTGGRGSIPADAEEKREVSRFVVKVVDSILGAEKLKTFTATFAIGKKATKVFNEIATGEDGDRKSSSDMKAIVKKIKDALLADEDIKASREILKFARRFKTTYDYKPEGTPPENTETVEEADAEASKKVSTTPSKSSTKIAAIQKIIKAPSSNGGVELGDGKWGGGTTEAWKAWVVTPETIQKIEKLKKDKESASQTENKYLNLNLLFEDTLDDAAADAAAEDSAIAKFVRDNAGNAASIAKELGYKPNLSGVDEMLKALEALDISTADKDQNSVQELTAEQRDKFEELNKLLDNNVSAGDMRTIHGIVHDLHSTGIFKKIKAVKGSDQTGNTLLKSLTAATDKKIATNILSNFSAGNYAPIARTVFPVARGPMFKSLDGESESLSFSVLVDDVEGIFLGKKPVYVKTGDARTSSEKAPAPVAESLSHGTLIRNRYGRY